MESGDRGIVLENELTCSVSSSPNFHPTARGALEKDQAEMGIPAQLHSFTAFAEDFDMDIGS